MWEVFSYGDDLKIFSHISSIFVIADGDDRIVEVRILDAFVSAESRQSIA